MATFYTIEIGYLSGEQYEDSKDAAWAFLKKVVYEIANSPDALWDEARNFDAPEMCDCGEDNCPYSLADWCEAFTDDKIADGSNAYKINEDGKYIIMIASGNRRMREHVCRAFCRLMIKRMHEQFIEVNIRVS